jgi:ribonuclease HI
MAALALVHVRWVPRHRNGEADRLSQQAFGGEAA